MTVRQPVENGAYFGFVRRAMKAAAKRVGQGDIDALPELVKLHEELDQHITEVVAQLRAEPHAYSWQQIADALGVSRDAAQKKYGKRRGVGGARKPGGQPSKLR